MIGVSAFLLLYQDARMRTLLQYFGARDCGPVRSAELELELAGPGVIFILNRSY